MRSLKLTFLIPFLFAPGFCPDTLIAQPARNEPLTELHPRTSLPNFFSKLHRGSPVTIAYFGGSITAAAGGWRDQSARWLQDQFPKAEVRQINSSIGGTGSDLGVFRLQNDVLSHHPDLVFVEFAVNDHGLAPERILRTMEGIVRQIRKADRTTDICFVYTLTATSAPTLVDGKLTNAMAAMEKVADHYGIPSIQLGLEVVSLFRQGKLLFSGVPEEHPDKVVFSKDNVHPYPQTGHRLYAEALARSLEKLKADTRTRKYKLVRPLSGDNWENARMIPAAELAQNGQWLQLSAESDSVARQLRERFPVLLKSETPGASLTLKFKGSVAGLYDIAGPGCGQYEITIDGQSPDGQSPKAYPRFDRYSTYYRSHYFFLPEMEDGQHVIKWEVSGEKLDKMAILKQGANLPGDLRKYEPNAVYAGYVLLLGEPQP